MKRSVLILLATGALTGCTMSSWIQRDYQVQQNLCRTEAEASLSAGVDTSTAAGQAVAGTRFSECMNKAGWRVSMPKATPVAQGPAPNPPSGSPSTDPIASTAAAAPQPGWSIRQSEAASKPPFPPSGAPSTAPSASAASVPSSAPPPAMTPPPSGFPPPARYQPARPPAVESAPYGTGAGRQF